LGAHDQGSDATTNRWVTIPRTLCFVTNGDDVLLMKRAPHRRVFPNKYNGLGGHVERDEDPLEGAIREIKEETGLDVRDVRLRAIHNIDAGQVTGILLFVFTAISDKRDFSENEDEGTLHWIPRNAITEFDLVEDLLDVMPRVLDETHDDFPLFVHVSYDADDQIQLRFHGEV